MTYHTLKSWPEFFQPISDGVRHHELRKDDRGGYQVGDVLYLREWDPYFRTYTGRKRHVTVTSITSADRPCAVSDAGLNPGYVILSIELGEKNREE